VGVGDSVVAPFAVEGAVVVEDKVGAIAAVEILLPRTPVNRGGIWGLGGPPRELGRPLIANPLRQVATYNGP
jgi:hypothetical protein